MLNQRAEFPAAVRRVLSQRVNYHCSSPTCRTGTTGPHSDGARAVSVGVAAHITAASAGGPRYDSRMPDEERASASNGIWLCQTCAKLIDCDEERFPVALLQQWKISAEALALGNLGKAPLFAKDSAPTVARSNKDYIAEMFRVTNSFDARKLYAVPPADDAEIVILAEGTTALNAPFVVVGVGTNYSSRWHITYFVATETGWNPQAIIELDGQKARRPKIGYIRGLPGALSIDHLSGTGTGLRRTDTSIYRIGTDSATPILHFPTYIHVVGWAMPFDRYLETISLIVPEVLVDRQKIIFRYRVRYEIDPQETLSGQSEPLLQYEYTFNLTWNAAAEQFVPETSVDDFSFLDKIWNETKIEFIERCRDDLLAFLESGTTEQRRFVERHLIKPENGHGVPRDENQ